MSHFSLRGSVRNHACVPVLLRISYGSESVASRIRVRNTKGTNNRSVSVRSSHPPSHPNRNYFLVQAPIFSRFIDVFGNQNGTTARRVGCADCGAGVERFVDEGVLSPGTASQQDFLNSAPMRARKTVLIISLSRIELHCSPRVRSRSN